MHFSGFQLVGDGIELFRLGFVQGAAFGGFHQFFLARGFLHHGVLEGLDLLCEIHV
ncbi:hypothetical protein D3C80_1866520 [compost metagenome]